MNNKIKLLNKKASMQLSINMIVILIMAVVVLGLGLGFINGMFGKMSDSFEGKANQVDPAPIASAANPLTASTTSLIIRPGESEVVKFSVFSGNNLVAATTTLSCLPVQAGLSIDPNLVVSADAGIPEPLTVLISAANGITANTHVCTFAITGGPSIDLVIDVKV